jgi:hypothetical protein
MGRDGVSSEDEPPTHCLDECGGMPGELPDVDNFLYRYYLTGTNENLRCFKGCLYTHILSGTCVQQGPGVRSQYVLQATVARRGPFDPEEHCLPVPAVHNHTHHTWSSECAVCVDVISEPCCMPYAIMVAILGLCMICLGCYSFARLRCECCKRFECCKRCTDWKRANPPVQTAAAQTAADSSPQPYPSKSYAADLAVDGADPSVAIRSNVDQAPSTSPTAHRDAASAYTTPHPTRPQGFPADDLSHAATSSTEYPRQPRFDWPPLQIPTTSTATPVPHTRGGNTRSSGEGPVEQQGEQQGGQEGIGYRHSSVDSKPAGSRPRVTRAAAFNREEVRSRRRKEDSQSAKRASASRDILPATPPTVTRAVATNTRQTDLQPQGYPRAYSKPSTTPLVPASTWDKRAVKGGVFNAFAWAETALSKQKNEAARSALPTAASL